MAKSHACAECNGRQYRVERRGSEAVATLCKCAAACRDCDGKGFVTVQQEGTFSQKVGMRRYDVLVPCPCRLLRARVESFNQTGVPGVLAHASFANYKYSNQAQQDAVQTAQRFALQYKKNAPGRGFILSGPVGTGKTHLLAAALVHLALESGVRTRYVEISLLYATIRRGFQEGKSGGEIIGPLSEVELLAIDELGKGRGSPFEMETLDELIARRYNAGRTTLFATNYSLQPERKSFSPTEYQNTKDSKDAASREEELLRKRTSERIYSRLCEMCDFLELPQETQDLRRTRHDTRKMPRTPAR